MKPTPEIVRLFRKDAGLTQRQAGELVYTKRQFERWENGERNMPPAIWELFLLKIGMHPTHKLIEK